MGRRDLKKSGFGEKKNKGEFYIFIFFPLIKFKLHSPLSLGRYDLHYDNSSYKLFFHLSNSIPDPPLSSNSNSWTSNSILNF